MHASSPLLILALAACGPRDPHERAPAVVDGLLGGGRLDPFPNASLVDDAGQLAIPSELLPKADTPLPVERLTWRSGFSSAQVSVARLPGIDPTGFPTFTAPTPGQGTVRLADLTDGAWLPAMAELDAWPDADDPVLLVRPLVHLPIGHRIAVAVTTEAIARPSTFDAVLAGQATVDAAHYVDLLEQLDALGLPEGDVALAWDFPIGDGALPLRSALAQLDVVGAFGFDRVRDADEGDTVAPFTWRALEGTFTVQDFLVDDRALSLAGDGSVAPTGTAEAELYVHVPASVADAPAGSVPILVFGHGIFGEPALYLDDPEDAGRVNEIADALGAIVVATTWRGLAYPDRLEVIEAAIDFGQLPTVTDRLVQAQVNVRTLAELVRTPAFAAHEQLRGRSGQALVDGSRVYYYGISLGAIEGMVALAQDPPFEASVFHVGGSMWSTMLERSSNWSTFELFVSDAIPDPADRQLLYAASQLFWDPVDPMAYAPDLVGRSFLLQESIGDEQVPNFTTEALARSVGLPVLRPQVTSPLDVAAVDADLPPGSRALVQLDPEVPLPAPVNRPAEITRAHELPRTWPGTMAQVIDALTPGGEGQVNHHCGEAPCAASNPGE